MKKKLLFAALATMGILPALQAQQLPDNGFQDAWVNCVPWTSGGNTKDLGTQPADWCISNVIGIGGTGKTQVGEMAEGYYSTQAVKVYNSPNSIVSTQIVPGYVTLGTTWSTSVLGSNNDGGTFGGITFDKRPDALSFMYKRAQGDGSDQPFSVVAYSWKGETSQADVPGDIKMFGSPTMCTMVNRERNVLGMETIKGGAVTTSDDFALIAEINKTYADTTSNWTNMVIPFDYKVNGTAPTMFNVIFGAGNYFDDQNLKKGDSLTIDDVMLLYYSQLSSLKVNGVDVAGFDKDTYAYTVDSQAPAAEAVTFEVLGQAAQGVASLDAETALLTIVVTNADDPASAHTYTVQFNKAETPTPEGTTYQGYLDIEMMGSSLATGMEATIVITPVSDGVVNFSLPNFQLALDPTSDPLSLGDINVPNVAETAIADGKSYKGTVTGMGLLGGAITADVNLDGTIMDNGTISMDIAVEWVQDEETRIPISVRFYYPMPEPEPEGTYNGLLDITMSGQTLVTGQGAKVEITENANGTVKFSLPNFTLEGIGALGDIVVPELTAYTKDDKVYYKGSVADLELLEGNLHAMVDVYGYITEAGEINLAIPVKWMTAYPSTDESTLVPIDVRFYTQGVDTSVLPELPDDFPTSVANVAADNETAIYYDLQGQRIANPGHGIYVRVQGGKATKIVK